MQVTNLTNLKAQLSGYIQQIEVSQEDLAIKKKNKVIVVMLPFDKYQQLKHSKKKLDLSVTKKKSPVDKFVGILKKSEADLDWKKSRVDYLLKKHA